MAVSQQQMAKIFDDKEQLQRWKEQMRRNKRLSPQHIHFSTDEKILTDLVEAIIKQPYDTFQYRHLSMKQHPTDVRSVMQYLTKYGYVIRDGVKTKGIVYRRLFEKNDIPLIMDEREKTSKTLTEKQYHFLDELIKEGEYTHSRKMVKIEQLTLAYYYYLRFKGGLERKNRLKYFKRRKSQKSPKANKPLYDDIPLKRGQVRKVMLHGKELGIMNVVKKSHQDLYQFKQEIIRGGAEELKKQLGIKEEER